MALQERAAATEAELRTALHDHATALRSVKDDARSLLEENAALEGALQASAVQEREQQQVVTDLMAMVQQQKGRLKGAQVRARAEQCCCMLIAAIASCAILLHCWCAAVARLLRAEQY